MSEDDIQHIIKSSFHRPVLIYKHSHRCSTGMLALSRIERDWGVMQDVVTPYMVNVIHERPISQKIAELLGIRHESPQVLLIRDGKCVYHESHLSISLSEAKQTLS